MPVSPTEPPFSRLRTIPPAHKRVYTFARRGRLGAKGIVTHVDGRLDGTALDDVPRMARWLERLGFDGAFAGESVRDPFLPVLLAAEHTERVTVGTSVAIVLPRNPLQVAHTAHDLHAYSAGRFLLGIGPQVRQHIERRFGVQWSAAPARIREFVLALRAIWRCWNEDERLEFQGEYYRHTLMTARFRPEPNLHGAPRVFLAAVGPRMTEVAGEVGDGILMHSLVTEKYLRETMLPALDRGLARSGRSRAGFELALAPLVVTGHNDEEQERAEREARDHLAFFASTGAYRPVLESHGWSGLQAELNTLLRTGKRAEMRAMITDEVLDAFALRGRPAEIPAKLLGRYGDLVSRINLRGPYREYHEGWVAVLRRQSGQERAQETG